MKPFLHRHTLHLTPLSPLHLGTGEDYEPTNYVIADGLLYAFDPTKVQLDGAQRESLLTAVKSGNLLKIQNFFLRNAELFKNASHDTIPVCKGLSNEYQRKIGQVVDFEKSGNKVFNRFQIERTSHSMNNDFFIPGSAIKGSFRTAILESLYLENTQLGNAIKKQYKKEDVKIELANELEKSLLKGDFENDFNRLYKISDLNQLEEKSLDIKIQYAINHEKDEFEARDNSTIAVRRETIQHGQYRSFLGSITLHDLLLGHKPTLVEYDCSIPENFRQLDINKLACIISKFNLKRFSEEISILESRKLLDLKWCRSIEQLLENIRPQIDKGEMIFVRLGKGCGSKSKTIDGLAHVKSKINKYADEYLPEGTTVWLAGEEEKSNQNLLPFGWAIIEIDCKEDNLPLQEWCKRNNAHYRRTAEKAEHDKRALLEQAQQAAEAARLANLPYWEKNLHDWQNEAQHLLDTKKGAGDQQTQELIKTIAEGLQTFLDDASLNAQIRTKIAETIRSIFPKNSPLLSEKKRKEQINPLLRQLQGE